MNDINSVRTGNGMRYDSQHFPPPESEVLKVLGAQPRTVVFERKQSAGCKLLVSLSEAVPVDTAVEIDHDRAFLLGEVIGCWKDATGTILAIVELSQSLCLWDAEALRSAAHLPKASPVAVGAGLMRDPVHTGRSKAAASRKRRFTVGGGIVPVWGGSGL